MSEKPRRSGGEGKMKRAPSSRDAPKDDYEPKHVGGSLLIPPPPSASPRIKVSPMLTRGGSATNLLSSSPPAGGSVITSGQAAWATKRQGTPPQSSSYLPVGSPQLALCRLGKFAAG